MKKLFQMLGLISLTCFSFFMTEKTALVVSDMDEIMIEIKANYKDYHTDSIDAIVDGNTIIPGICAKDVNINKSYKNMKQSGYYSDKLYIYDYTKPKISLSDNIDKYIIKGNPNKRIISLIFKVDSNDNIDDILNIVNNYNINVTFFIDTNWFTNNNELIGKLINDGHNIGIFLDDYSDSNFEWMDMVIKKINNQRNSFCYSKEDNENNLQSCIQKHNYTIRPIEISEKTPLVDIKKSLNAGSILSLDVNSQVRKELSTIIIFIKSKGFNIDNLENHLLE